MPLFAAARRKWTGYDWSSSAPHYNKAVVSLGYCCTRRRCRVQARPAITDEANIRTPARSLSADPKLNGMEQADVDHA